MFKEAGARKQAGSVAVEEAGRRVRRWQKITEAGSRREARQECQAVAGVVLQ